ncbi:MAG: hypothetical protein M0R80_00710 [Proteobacteria bacterium]|jgi:hypothetical protein|nr:hypothetical protein [Pseudomonadota bacterium]
MMPETAEQWWTLVEQYHDELRELVSTFHPCNHTYTDFAITAEVAEAICEQARAAIRAKDADDPIERFEQYRTEKNPKLASLLNETWFGMPESTEVRSYPGFGVLCNLCSEAYVLQEDDCATY